MHDNEDLRPDPKPRKHIHLWQAYLIWNELVEMRKRHTLRISSIERGKSLMDIELEERFLERLRLDENIDLAKQEMIEYGEDLLSIWEWVTSIKGLGSGSLAARLLAMIDDIAKFGTISKLWRYSGYGMFDYWVNENGKVVAPKAGWKWKTVKGKRVKEYVVAEPKAGWKLVTMIDRGVEKWALPYSKPLKSTLYLIVDQFIKQRTPVYRDLYDAKKTRLRIDHSQKINLNGKIMYNDGHINNMAIRKVAKIFLSHLWTEWRESEGLPVSKPYAEAILGHSNIIGVPKAVII